MKVLLTGGAGYIGSHTAVELIATQEIDNLVFKQEINFIREQAKQRSYENLENILDSIQKTKVRLKANVNFDLAFELLFLTIREK